MSKKIIVRDSIINGKKRTTLYKVLVSDDEQFFIDKLNEAIAETGDMTMRLEDDE